jgi:hypothetical protein
LGHANQSFFIIIFGNKKTPASAGVFVVGWVKKFIHLQRRKHPAQAGWYGNGCGGGCFCWKSFSKPMSSLIGNRREYDKPSKTSQVKILAATLYRTRWMVILQIMHTAGGRAFRRAESNFFRKRPWRYLMQNRIALYLVAVIGLFGTGRMTDAQVTKHSAEGPASTQKRQPAIDLEISAETLTATFALG